MKLLTLLLLLLFLFANFLYAPWLGGPPWGGGDDFWFYKPIKIRLKKEMIFPDLVAGRNIDYTLSPRDDGAAKFVVRGQKYANIETTIVEDYIYI